MIRTIGYIRVSTDKQADCGLSLEAQTAKLQAQAVVEGISIDEIITDAGESAKSLNRPGMARLLALVDSGAVQTVIICKLDRLTRSVADLAELLKRFDRRGVSLVSVNDKLDTATAAGRLVLNIMVSVSQWEREATGERTREVLRHKKTQGMLAGNTPFGYRLLNDARDEHGKLIDSTLIKDELEQEIISRIQELRTAGFTLEQIARELNALGFTTRSGGEFKKQYIHNICKAAA